MRPKQSQGKKGTDQKKKKKDGRRGGYSGVFLNLSFPQNYIHCLTAVLDLPSFNIHRSQGFQPERRGK